MKIIASQVIYSNAIGDGKLMNKVKGFVNKQKSEGSLFNKAKGLVNKVKSGQVGGGEMSQQSAPEPSYTPPPPASTGMSKGMKTGLIIGGSVVGLLLIVGVVVAIKKSK